MAGYLLADGFTSSYQQQLFAGHGMSALNQALYVGLWSMALSATGETQAPAPFSAERSLAGPEHATGGGTVASACSGLSGWVHPLIHPPPPGCRAHARQRSPPAASWAAP